MMNDSKMLELAAKAAGYTRDLQVWLGHTNPTTTARYAHLNVERLQEVARNANRKAKTSA